MQLTEKRKKYHLMANAVRFLSADAVENAKSGHPGMPMGMAEVATLLFSLHLNFYPKDPNCLIEIGLFFLRVMVQC